MNQTIFIGDVHGCPDEVVSLLRACGQVAGDEIVFVGDLVAKGPDSKGVVQLVRELRARSVMGNHDDAAVRARVAMERDEPLGRFKPTHREAAEALSADEAAWLASLPAYLIVEPLRVLVVHAGLLPGRSLLAQDRADLLTMRSVTPDGKPSKRVDDGVPWASLWEGPDEVVFGHDAIRGLQRYPKALGLDTGCVYGRRLTAWVMPERRLVSVQAKRAYCAPSGQTEP